MSFPKGRKHYEHKKFCPMSRADPIFLLSLMEKRILPGEEEWIRIAAAAFDPPIDGIPAAAAMVAIRPD